KGSPIKDAVIEIWQCDNNGTYLHSRESGRGKKYDKNFQGFGKFTTNAKGEYRFRTIKPVPYAGRTPHIHFKVKKGDRTLLTSQIFIAGHSGNARDGVFRGLRDPLDRELVLADWKKVKDSKTGDWAAKFDIVLGRTPDEEKEDKRPKR